MPSGRTVSGHIPGVGAAYTYWHSTSRTAKSGKCILFCCDAFRRLFPYLVIHFKREGNELHVHLSHLHILNLEVVDLIIDGAIYSN